MSRLALDTSGAYPYLALENSGQIFEWQGSSAESHSEELSAGFRSLLEQSQSDQCAIAEVIVGEGPGSFTGLRIGLSFAKGIAVALRVPLTMMPSLFAFADEHLSELPHNTFLWSIGDARRKEVFRLLLQRNFDETISTIKEASIISLKALHEEWSTYATSYSKLIVNDETFREKLPSIPVTSHHVARAHLLGLSGEGNRSYSVEEIAVASPTYLRSVAAKTIAERSQSPAV